MKRIIKKLLKWYAWSIQDMPNFSNSAKVAVSHICTVDCEPASGFFKTFRNFGCCIWQFTNRTFLKSIFIHFSSKHFHLHQCQLFTGGNSIWDLNRILLTNFGDMNLFCLFKKSRLFLFWTANQFFCQAYRMIVEPHLLLPFNNG
jgi:hypothetical protein